MGMLNKSGKGTTGKNRKNAPSASEKATPGNADARKFASFEGVGGDPADATQGGGKAGK